MSIVTPTRGWIMVDLDGTICDTRHRAHFIDRAAGTPPDWDAYCLACTGDTAISGVVALVELLSASWDIAFITGRSNIAFDHTLQWLKTNTRTPFQFLGMREAGDRQNNISLKLAWYEHLRNQATVHLVIDDHPGVIEEFQKLDVPALLVPRDGCMDGQWQGTL